MTHVPRLLLLACLVAASPGVAQQQSARGTKYMVAAPTPEAVEAALSILERGGNAVDAAAAAAFALMVTDPAMCSVGGRSQILLRLKDGTLVGIDGATQAPLRVAEPARLGHGYRTAPIPGSPAALEQMVREHGTLPLSEILQPAIRLADEGFRVNGTTTMRFGGTERRCGCILDRGNTSSSPTDRRTPREKCSVNRPLPGRCG
jgi:gamma-glutamyltranspeptidase/glutathione hydrolase